MIICENCEAEFNIKVHNELPVKFCPCCGEPLHQDDDWGCAPRLTEDDDETAVSKS
mgnify:CR=1 FL=1